ncbi:MAG TPA: hypothetical protein VNU92_01980, partial [Edaphobacter sp.]|nr:hypothetical protein [Edaphobacter sp.]
RNSFFRRADSSWVRLRGVMTSAARSRMPPQSASIVAATATVRVVNHLISVRCVAEVLQRKR